MKKYTLKSGSNFIDFVAPSEELALAEAKRIYLFASFVVHQVSDNLGFGANPLHCVR